MDGLNITHEEIVKQIMATKPDCVRMAVLQLENQKLAERVTILQGNVETESKVNPDPEPVVVTIDE